MKLDDLKDYLDDEAYTIRVGELRALLAASVPAIADTATVEMTIDEASAVEFYAQNPAVALQDFKASYKKLRESIIGTPTVEVIADTAGAKPDSAAQLMPRITSAVMESVTNETSDEILSVLTAACGRIRAALASPAIDTAGAKPVAKLTIWNGEHGFCGAIVEACKGLPDGDYPLYLASPAIDAAAVSEQTLRTLVYQIEDLKPSKHKDNAENAIAILRNAFRKAIDAAGARSDDALERAAQVCDKWADFYGDEESSGQQFACDRCADDIRGLKAAGASSDMTYAQIAEKLSDDGYSKQADVIRQIIRKEQG